MVDRSSNSTVILCRMKNNSAAVYAVFPYTLSRKEAVEDKCVKAINLLTGVEVAFDLSLMYKDLEQFPTSEYIEDILQYSHDIPNVNILLLENVDWVMYNLATFN